LGGSLSDDQAGKLLMRAVYRSRCVKKVTVRQSSLSYGGQQNPANHADSRWEARNYESMTLVPSASVADRPR
jgi:hypothetical protein